MTVRGAVAPVFCGLLTRNRWPSLVTAYMLLSAERLSRKKRLWQPGRGTSGQVDRHRRHHPSRVDIEQLSAIGPPVRIPSSIRRNPMLPAGAKKWLNVDVWLAGLVGRIRDPSTVRGERSLTLGELGLCYWKRFALPKERKGPDVRCRRKRRRRTCTTRNVRLRTSRSARVRIVARHMAVKVSLRLRGEFPSPRSGWPESVVLNAPSPAVPPGRAWRLPNTISVPFGDHTGHPSGCASVVTRLGRLGRLGAVSIVQISRFSGLARRRATATWRSSGESEGLASTPPSPRVPRGLPARSNHVSCGGFSEPPDA